MHLPKTFLFLGILSLLFPAFTLAQITMVVGNSDNISFPDTKRNTEKVGLSLNDFRPGVQLGFQFIDDRTSIPGTIFFLGAYLKNSNLLALTPRINFGIVQDNDFGIDYYLLETGFSIGLNSKFGAVGFTGMFTDLYYAVATYHGDDKHNLGNTGMIYIGTGRLINRLELQFEMGIFRDYDRDKLIRAGMTLNYTFYSH